MHVLIDMRSCHEYQDRGISRYVQELTIELASRHRENRYSFLLLRNASAIRSEMALAQLGRVLYYEDLIGGIEPINVFLIGCVVDHLDVAGAFERYMIPPAIAEHRPLLSAIAHDFIPILFRERYLPTWTSLRRYLSAMEVTRNLDVIFAISQSTAADAVRLLSRRREDIVVVHGGVDRDRWKPLKPARLDNREFVCVAGDDSRKNVDALIDAFGMSGVAIRGYKLAVVFKTDQRRKVEMEDRAKSAGLRVGADIVFTGLLSDAAIVKRVQNAFATIFPSRYEGLGLPVLESYACEVPVVGSNNSSVGELVHPDYCFDPCSVDDMSDRILRVTTDPQFRDRSVAFGREVLARCNWPNVADIIVESIADRVTKHRGRTTAAPKVAIVGTLAPEQSGVAIFNSKAFSKVRADIDLYSPSATVGDLWDKRVAVSAGPEGFLHRVNAGRDLAVFHKATGAPTAVFVLNNSGHSLGVLREAMAFQGRTRRFLYLHEARVIGLLWSHYLDMSRFKAALQACYPEYGAADFDDDKLFSGRIMGLRLLLQLVGKWPLIVNSQRAREHCIAELGRAAPDINVLFHPFLSTASPTPPVYAGNRPLRIGHFGIVGAVKQPELLAKAVEIVGQRQPVELLFAGFEIVNVPRSPLVRTMVAASEAEFLKAMRGVDVAVQPRRLEHGESSGVVRQLISAGHRPLVSSGTADAELVPLVTIFDRDVGPAELAVEIEAAARRPRAPQPSQEHLSKYSLERYGEEFLQIVSG